MTMTDKKPVTGSFTTDDIDPDNLSMAFRGYPTRATQIKELWEQCATHWQEQIAMLHIRPYGWVMDVPDPQDPRVKLLFEKINYGGQDVIECEGVIVCRLKK